MAWKKPLSGLTARGKELEGPRLRFAGGEQGAGTAAAL